MFSTEKQRDKDNSFTPSNPMKLEARGFQPISLFLGSSELQAKGAWAGCDLDIYDNYMQKQNSVSGGECSILTNSALPPPPQSRLVVKVRFKPTRAMVIES